MKLPMNKTKKQYCRWGRKHLWTIQFLLNLWEENRILRNSWFLFWFNLLFKESQQRKKNLNQFFWVAAERQCKIVTNRDWTPSFHMERSTSQKLLRPNIMQSEAFVPWVSKWFSLSGILAWSKTLQLWRYFWQIGWIIKKLRFIKKDDDRNKTLSIFQPKPHERRH